MIPIIYYIMGRIHIIVETRSDDVVDVNMEEILIVSTLQ